jgi:hypothetical protein
MAEPMITVLPIVGWKIAAHPTGTGLLDIRWIPGIPPPGATQEQIDKATQSHQYGIHAEQCDELAEILIELAGRLRAAKASLN